MAKSKKAEPTLAEVIAAAESQVAALEKGDLDLESSLKLYEQGVANMRTALGIINRVETKIKTLDENAAGEIVTGVFPDTAETE